MPDTSRAVLEKPLARYTMAVLVVAASFFLRFAIVRYLGVSLPVYITFYPAIMLVAVVAGLGPGLFATALLALGTDYMILPPTGHFTVANTSDVIALTLFAIMGILMSVLAELYRRSQRAVAAYKEQQAQRRSKADLQKESEYRQLALEAAELGTWEVRLESGDVSRDDCCCKLFGGRPGEGLGNGRLIERAHPDDRRRVEESVSQAIAKADGRLWREEFRVVWPDGSTHWVMSCGRAHSSGDDSNPRAGRMIGVVMDITERKMGEKHIEQLNRVYAVLSDINQTIVRERDTQAMLESACRTAVEKGKFPMAWIGMVDAGGKALRPVASSGKVDGYLDRLRIDVLDPIASHGPAAQTVLCGTHQICNDIEHDPAYLPWREEALRRGYRSSAGFPLKVDGQVIGVFNLYAGEPQYFAGDELALLDEMAMDISFALEVNRLEEERKKSEQHIRRLNRVYTVLSDINQNIVREKDPQAMLEAACRIAVEKGQFCMAWIGTIDPATQQLKPIASSGKVDGYLDRVKIDFLDSNTASGPAARSYATGTHAICNDIEHDLDRPWRNDALRNGYRSEAAFPLRLDGNIVGVFCLYASELAFFDDDEIQVLDEMGMDISYALEVNRHEQDRQKADEELRWRTAFFEAQVDSALDGVLVLDRNGKKILQNQRLSDLFGIPLHISNDPDDAVQFQFVRALVKNPDRFEEKVNRLNSHPEEVSRDEVELIDDTILERYSAPVRDKALNYYGRIWTFRDITERRQLEEQFRQAQKMEAVGQLTGGIAHDFNNQLQVILGCSEFISRELEGNPRLSRMAEMIVNAAKRGADLTHRMLAFARRQTLQPRPVDVNKLLVDMESFLRRTLSVEIELEIAQRGEECNATVDPTQLDNALLNLCVNARDAMPGGGTLIVGAKNVVLDIDYADQNPGVTPGQYVLIEVSDTGCGIGPENLPRVFEPFFTTKGAGKGTGLGLSMVYGFAKQSQGHVKIYSEQGCGTSVRLYLPKANQEDDLARQNAISKRDIRGSEVILLVEDNAPVREFAKSQLADLGYRVLEAASGKEALQVIEEHPDIDLLFTDVVMPGGMNGRELAFQASKLNPRLKVLFCSGYAESAIVHQGLLDRGVQLLNKPYTRLELGNTIRRVLAAS